jgi:integrase/recombinase XerD
MIMSSLGVGAGGEMAVHVPGFRAALSERGFAPRTIRTHVELLRSLGDWLQDQGLAAGELTAECVTRFLDSRRVAGARGALTPFSMTPLLGYLQQLGIVSSRSWELPASTEILQRYRAYLRSERGLVAPGVIRYEKVAGLFTESVAAPDGKVDWSALSGREVSRFMLAECAGRGGSSARNLAAGLRSFLRFLHVEGCTPTALAAAVSPVPGWRGRSLPVGLEVGQVQRLLQCCDRGRATGRRDFAILTVLARLGLRAAEVAGMRLDDLDWRAGELIVHGKGQRDERLPLPSDVGAAIAEYLRGRPPTASRAVFLRMLAPRLQLTPTAVTTIVYRACDRAGLPRVGAHRLRHGAASQMLAAGASLSEVGQALRQRSARTTAIYAKVDHARLGVLARPWPGDLA